MGPFSGNGAGQAIEDAAVLSALFAQVKYSTQISTAFSAYDVTRRERSQKAVEITRNFGRLYVYALEEVGAEPDKMTDYLRTMGSYLNNVDLEAQNAEAIQAFEKSLNQV